jgi:hypothetical protein
MSGYFVEILHPKALKLLKDLEELNLISVKETGSESLQKTLDQLRSHAAPTPEEISQEVEEERLKRYDPK